MNILLPEGPYMSFFCANVLAVCEEILIFVALNKKET